MRTYWFMRWLDQYRITRSTSVFGGMAPSVVPRCWICRHIEITCVGLGRGWTMAPKKRCHVGRRGVRTFWNTKWGARGKPLLDSRPVCQRAPTPCLICKEGPTSLAELETKEGDILNNVQFEWGRNEVGRDNGKFEWARNEVGGNNHASGYRAGSPLQEKERVTAMRQLRWRVSRMLRAGFSTRMGKSACKRLVSPADKVCWAPRICEVCKPPGMIY